MISIHYAGVVYFATLSGCFDGDTCRVIFPNFPPLVAEQRLRFDGFDAPEMGGGCPRSKKLARQAQAATFSYMQGDVRLEFVNEPEKYGRLVVRAPELEKRLIAQGLAKPSQDGQRQDWCD